MKVKITEVKPPQSYYPKNPFNTISIFLAGSIEMDKAEMWQDQIFKRIKSIGTSNKSIEEIVIYNPRRDNWDSSWEQSIEDVNFVKQVEWELEHIEQSNLVIFYLQPGTKSPISLMELGIVSKESLSNEKNVIVLCPDGFHRKGNVDITARWFDMNTANDMEDLVQKTIKVIDLHEFHI